ncbi:hypothetical protein ONS96_005352 [Cadophora gregata f. sp. sojae]|nr:hypothetical protein ONS96_005352 [Cadophora gregata f. sp. sojae]
MAHLPETTYNALITPIPAKINLANVADHDAGKICGPCSTIVPDRRKLNKVGTPIKCGYERVDLYPDFPDLKASSKSATLREDDGLWDDLFADPWDRKVKIYQPTFLVENTVQVLGSGLEFNGNCIEPGIRTSEHHSIAR